LPFWQRGWHESRPAAKLEGMRIDVPGGHINAVIEGEGPLVLLLHGFPEGAWAWRHQLPALAAAGHRGRVVAKTPLRGVCDHMPRTRHNEQRGSGREAPQPPKATTTDLALSP
jgi:hypothetical protein